MAAQPPALSPRRQWSRRHALQPGTAALRPSQTAELVILSLQCRQAFPLPDPPHPSTPVVHLPRGGRASSPPRTLLGLSSPVRCGKRAGQGCQLRWAPCFANVWWAEVHLAYCCPALTAFLCPWSPDLPAPPALDIASQPHPAKGRKCQREGADVKRNKHYLDCCLLYFCAHTELASIARRWMRTCEQPGSR